MERNDVQRIVAALGIYFLLHLGIRLIFYSSPELDEAEQLLLAQQLSFGYGSQPPLYTWLVAGLFKLFGVSIFCLALLKNTLLFSTYLLTYHAARGFGYDRTQSVVAMLSLLFIPQIAWESQRDLTHSVLAVTLVAATIVSLLKAKREPSTHNYLLLGLCWGAGFLAKYNYAVFWGSLVIASLTITEYRSLLLRRRAVYAFGMMLTVVAPHAIWAATHIPALMSSSSKFKQAVHKSYVASVLKGTSSLLLAAVAFAGPLLLIYGLLWYRRRRDQLRQSSSSQSPALLLRCVLISLLICLLMVLVFRVTAFKDRWMQPILFFLPLVLMPFVGTVLATHKARIVRLLALFVACLTLTGMALRVELATAMGSKHRFNLPYRVMLDQLAPLVAASELVLAPNAALGGLLRLQYPETHITCPGVVKMYHNESPSQMLVVWQNKLTEQQGQDIWPIAVQMMGGLPVVSSGRTVTASYDDDSADSLQITSVLLTRSMAAKQSN
jgi:4-amino-4-deoxy-L-arabinose transferase-like glycosyltransferase